METEEKRLNRPACGYRIKDFKNMTLWDLEHIASCDSCAAWYAAAIEEHAMIKAPRYMKDNILREYKGFTEIRKENSQSRLGLPWRKLQLFGYSVKIGLAMCGALALLNLVPAGSMKSREPSAVAGSVQSKEPSALTGFLNKMNSELKEVSDNILEYTDILAVNVNADHKDYKENLNYDKKKE